MLERKVTHSSWQLILGLQKAVINFLIQRKTNQKKPLPNKDILVEAAYVLLFDVGYKKKVTNIFGPLPLEM